MAGRERGGEAHKTAYEIQRDKNIASKNMYLKKLNLPPIHTSGTPKKSRKKFMLHEDQRSPADGDYVADDEEMAAADTTDDEDEDYDNEEDGVHYEPVQENEEHAWQAGPNEENNEQDVQVTKKRGVRGPTKMKSIIATRGKFKIYVKINRYGQPCGIKTCKFTNFIATLVKGGDISLMHHDWRLVKNKEVIWTKVNKYFVIDPVCKDWVMTSASKKWRDFKSTLKKLYFEANLSEAENIANGCGQRIPDPEWVWLVKHWCKDETKAKAQKNKEIRENQGNAVHTCGSRSYAVVSDILEGELGREPCRAELYIVTHTKANGESVNEMCQNKIDEIRERIENDPSLVTKTIDQGDMYDDMFPKEQKGRIHGLGLLAGGSKSVALARTAAAMVQLEEDNAELTCRLEEMSRAYNSYKEQAEQKFQQSDQRYDELKKMLLDMQASSSATNGVGSGGPIGVGSNIPINRSGSSSNNQAATAKEARFVAPANKEVQSTPVDKEAKTVGVHKRGDAAIATKKRKERTVQDIAVANGQKINSPSCANSMHVDKMNQSRGRKLGQNQQGGNKDVALRSLVGSNIVAYGRITCTDKNAKGVDGLPLGDYCEVLVDVVLDKNVLLPRVQGQATKLGSAVGRCIAWPFQNVVQTDGSPLPKYRRSTDCGK